MSAVQGTQLSLPYSPLPLKVEEGVMEKTKELKFLTHLGLTSAGPGAYEVRRCWRVGMILIGTMLEIIGVFAFK